MGDVENIDPLASLKSLTHFEAGDWGTVDITPLSLAPKLKEVHFVNSACDISPLASVKKLETLFIRNANAEQLATVVTERKSTLKFLAIYDIKMGTSLCAAIGECAKLTTLSLGGVENADMATICNADALTSVVMDTVNSMANHFDLFLTIKICFPKR